MIWQLLPLSGKKRFLLTVWQKEAITIMISCLESHGEIMQTNVLEYLEKTAVRVPDKLAYADDKTGITFEEVLHDSQAIGSFLHGKGICQEPVLVFMKKSPSMVEAFFGVVYARDFYVPLDDEMPLYRLNLIIENVKARAVICDEKTKKMMEKLDFQGEIFLYQEMISCPVDREALEKIRESAIDVDPIYVVFTSGSTGVPKGVAACHRSVLDYVENLSQVLGFSRDTVFANQSPFYFDACLKELYPTIMFGATTYIVPKALFMFPVRLVEFLNQHKVNTICWVVSALTMISSFGTFDMVKPEYLHTIAFGSEIFPIRQYQIWKEAVPKAEFFNLYGPTEATGMSCYYKVDREFSLEDSMPIGRPFKNTEILLLDENNRPAREGEILIRGTAVTFGYYNNNEKTQEVFIQNPLNPYYRDIVYRTGDIGAYNERGELVFVSRKDYQIKHMGHRIELGEIEVHTNLIESIKLSACIYDKENSKIVLFYVGEVTAAEIIGQLKEKLPRYMLPNRIEKIAKMPFTANGKINRLALKEQIKENE